MLIVLWMYMLTYQYHYHIYTYYINVFFTIDMGLNRSKIQVVHYNGIQHCLSWLTATVEPFFPTPPTRITDTLLCASKTAMPTAAHKGKTFTSVLMYGNYTFGIYNRWLVEKREIYTCNEYKSSISIIDKNASRKNPIF